MRAPLRSTDFSSCARRTMRTAKSVSSRRMGPSVEAAVVAVSPAEAVSAAVAAEPAAGVADPSPRATATSTISPVRDSSASGMTMTPSRTVAICGTCSGLTMVAMMLPPKAGRIW